MRAGVECAAVEKAARAEAETVLRMLWSPTFGLRCAMVDVFCPGCGTSRAIDLCTIDQHRLASVDTLVLGLRCS
jgi:hypothetical protein